MAVLSETTTASNTGGDLSSLLTGGNMGNLFGGNGNEGGLIGGLILGSLLNNGNMFGNRNGNNNLDTPTSADVQNIVATNAIQRDTAGLKGEIWQAEGQVQLAVAGTTNATLQGQNVIGKQISDSATSSQIQNLQGQIALMSQIDNQNDALHVAIVDSARSAAKDAADISKDVAVGSAAAALATTEAKFELAQVISNDGDKTRALIQSINTADLNRQITIAENKLAEALGDNRATKSGVEVTTIVNQAQAQAQAQQQQILTNQLLNTLVSELQVAKANIVNLGTMSGSAGQQSNTNVKA
jgi:hypothetical protein